MSEIVKNKVKKRSKKYRSNEEKIAKALEGKNSLEIEQAVELLFQLDQPKFKDGAMVEIHAKLNINPTKSDQLVRSSVVLPHGSGKKVVVAAFVTPENEEKAKQAGADIVGGEGLIEEIKKSQEVNFDKAVAEPEMMKKLPSIAKILGIAGVMPNPKTGTVGTNLEEMIGKIKAGKIDFKNDKTGNLHIVCGKINKNFSKEKITENVKAAVEAIEKAKPEAVKKKFVLSLFLSTSQSPSIRITKA
jgi:large subunit ribosomal protein L1